MRLSTSKFMGFFDVDRDETVTITITPVGTGGTYVASIDGCPPPDPASNTCTVTITEDQPVLFQFFFQPADPDTARFDLRFSGSVCGEIGAPPVRKSHALWKRTYTFLVVPDSCS